MEDYSFANYSVYDLRRYLIFKGITVESFRKASLVKLAEATVILVLEDEIDFHEDVCIVHRVSKNVSYKQFTIKRFWVVSFAGYFFCALTVDFVSQ